MHLFRLKSKNTRLSKACMPLRFLCELNSVHTRILVLIYTYLIHFYCITLIMSYQWIGRHWNLTARHYFIAGMPDHELFYVAITRSRAPSAIRLSRKLPWWLFSHRILMSLYWRKSKKHICKLSSCDWLNGHSYIMLYRNESCVECWETAV